MTPKEVDFTEFGSQNKEAWLAQAVKKLKDHAIEDLATLTYEGITVKPYYDRSDLPTTFIKEVQQVCRRPNPSYQSCVKISLLSEAETSLQITEALEGGADLIILSADEQPTTTLISFIKKAKANFPAASFVLNTLQSAHWEDAFLRSSLTAFHVDPLHHYLETGKPFEATLAAYGDTLQKSTDLAALPITVNGHAFHNAGGQAVQELAFTLSMAVAYLDTYSKEESLLPSLLNRVVFSVTVGSHFFMEIAKLRALRWLWNKVAHSFLPTEDEPRYPLIYAQTSTWNKSPQEAYNNMLRATTETMAAFIGGADRIAVQPYDIPFTSGDTFSFRMARNLPILLKEESYLHKVEDIAAGAYFIENLTQQLCEKAWQLFQETERQGGFMAICKNGFLQAQIEATAAQKVADFKSGKLVLVGTNKYSNQDDQPLQSTYQVPKEALLDTTPLALRN
ncbi:MAG: methylmalonyl-CoA mutase family protein [Thermonemataceae bacterium]